jgi:hypothetical protein
MTDLVKMSAADFLNEFGMDIDCKVCGKTFRTATHEAFYREYCCVRCEILTHDWAKENFKECEHGHWTKECIKCKQKEK